MILECYRGGYLTVDLDFQNCQKGEKKNAE